MIKFSIIVPVYNVEPYLEECIDGVLSQTYFDFELILVNDGSTDKSSDICNRYAKKDDRVTAIHKENGGSSSARNAGTQVATGDYIIFLDSDDYWDDPEALTGISDIIRQENVDVVVWWRKIMEYPSGDIKLLDITPVLKSTMKESKTAALKALYDADIYDASSCMKAFSRELMVENNLLFEEGTTGEDFVWCVLLAIYASAFALYSNPFYVNRKRPDSISVTPSDKNFADVITQRLKMCEIVCNLEDIELQSAMEKYASKVYWGVVQNVLKKGCLDDYYDEIKKYTHLFKYYRKSRFWKIRNLIIRTLGLRFGLRLMKFKMNMTEI